MPISMYDASVPVFARGLGVVFDLVDHAARHTLEHGLDPARLIEARLAPDMLTFAGQVQRASDSAKFGVARLAGVESPSFPDDETTFDALRDRCAKTVSYLRGFAREALEGSETRSVTFGGAASRRTLPGDAYLLSFALPNFFFHVTTAYDILRREGLSIGKRDYLGRYDAPPS